MNWWQTILLDIVGAVVSLAVAAAVAYLAHRAGKLGRPLGALAGWLRAEGGTLGDSALLAIERAVTAELTRHGLPVTPVEADPAVLQGDAGFRIPPATSSDLVAPYPPGAFAPGDTITVNRGGTYRAYTVEGAHPGDTGAAYRLRPTTDNAGVNEGDDTVPGSSRG